MPTDASEAEVKTMMQLEAGLLARLRNVLYLDSPSYKSREDTAWDAVEGQTKLNIEAMMTARRATLSNALGAAGAPSVQAMLAAYQVQQNWNPAGNAWLQLYEHWAGADTPVTVKTRAWTFGAASAGASNVGNGTIYRNTTDKYGYPIESGRAGTREYICVADVDSGTPIGSEQFSVRGTPAGPDLLDPRGAGIAGTLIGVTAIDTTQLVINPSFDTYQATNNVLSSLTGWVPNSTAAAFEIDTTQVYRTYQGAPSGQASLRFKEATALSISQIIQNTSRRSFIRTAPYFAAVAFKREDSCDGTLKLTIGTKTVSVELSAQTGWNLLVWKLDQDAWYDNFTEDNLAVEIELEGRSTGTLLIDDFIMVPMAQVGPRFETLLGGSTPFSTGGNSGYGDLFTIQDSFANADAYMQNWADTSGIYLPSSSSPTFTEPTP